MCILPLRYCATWWRHKIKCTLWECTTSVACLARTLNDISQTGIRQTVKIYKYIDVGESRSPESSMITLLRFEMLKAIYTIDIWSGTQITLAELPRLTERLRKAICWSSQHRTESSSWSRPDHVFSVTCVCHPRYYVTVADISLLYKLVQTFEPNMCSARRDFFTNESYR